MNVAEFCHALKKAHTEYHYPVIEHAGLLRTATMIRLVTAKPGDPNGCLCPVEFLGRVRGVGDERGSLESIARDLDLDTQSLRFIVAAADDVGDPKSQSVRRQLCNALGYTPTPKVVA